MEEVHAFSWGFHGVSMSLSLCFHGGARAVMVLSCGSFMDVIALPHKCGFYGAFMEVHALPSCFHRASVVLPWLRGSFMVLRVLSWKDP